MSTQTESRKEYARQYYIRNREHIRARNDEWKKNNPDKVRKNAIDSYYRNHEKNLARINTDEYRKKNAEWAKKKYYKNYSEVREYQNNWQRSEKSREYQRAYYHKNKEKFRIKDKIQNARRRSAGYLTRKEVQALYEDNIKHYGTLTCYLCGKQIEFGKDHLDHKLPITRGGITEFSNMGVSCQRCNLSKNNKTVDEFMEVLNARR